MAAVSVPEAFILLTLPSASLTTNGFTHSGDLQLQHITANVPDESGVTHEEVFLVLRLRELEIALDPDRPVSLSTADPHRRIYTFGASTGDAAEEIQLAVPASTPTNDLETLDTVLAQYFATFENEGALAIESMTALPETLNGDAMRPVPHINSAQADKLRGHLVLVNEDNGEIVGQLDQRLPVREDPGMRGSRDPVVVEVPDEAGLFEHDANARELFVRAIPPEQQNWMTKGAGLASYAISTGASLIAKGMGVAADYYVAHGAKSPDHPDNRALTNGADGSSTNAFDGSSTPTAKPALPPRTTSRTMTMLTSPRTRQNMQRAHKYTGTAVKASAKTVAAVDELIRRAVYGKEKAGASSASGTTGKGKGKRLAAAAAANSQSAPTGSEYSTPSGYSTPGGYSTPPAAVSSTSLAAPPPYTPGQTYLAPEKPKLPPRRSPSPGATGSVPYPVYTSGKGASAPASPYATSPSSYAPSSVPPWTSGPPSPHAVYDDGKETGPPPRGTSGPPPGFAGTGASGAPGAPPPLPPRELKTRDRVLLSADLILSTIDDSTRQLIEAGVVNFGKVMGHRYGKDAGETSTMAARTAQNVGLVYIDLSGLGRRALIKRAGKHYVKSKFGGKNKTEKA
ncbi:hypothetical protein EV715DRAFT_251024 [Schizophyllum commune]